MRYLVLLFSLIVFGFAGYAQDEDYDDEHIESSLPNFSSFYANSEYYQFTEKEKAIDILVNGKIEFGNSHYLNIEILGARYLKDGMYGYTPGDFSLTYTKNFYSEKYLDSGFQGVSPSVKIILPTGKVDYSGLFGHWILEPAIYYSWLLTNENFFFSNRWRLFFPVINVRDAAEPPQLIRFEPRFGFENRTFWISITLDNRYVFNMEEYVFFCRGDFGFKLNERNGISAFYTKRIYNTVLFDTYASIGYYHIF